MLLKDKSAIVTGAASGIGRAVAISYARAGAKVIASDTAEAGGEETVRLIRGELPSAKAVFVRADALADSADRRKWRISSCG